MKPRCFVNDMNEAKRIACNFNAMHGVSAWYRKAGDLWVVDVKQGLTMAQFVNSLRSMSASTLMPI